MFSTQAMHSHSNDSSKDVINTGTYAFGSGSNGQLGLGSELEDQQANINEPTLIKELQGRDLISVSCGAQHSAVVTGGGELFTFGDNEFGQLGRRRKLGEPGIVDALESHVILQVACGQAHTFLLTRDGQIFAFGRNNFGQLGCSPQEVDQSVRPRLIKALSDKKIVKIASGANHGIALADNGVAWSWGCGLYGQLGRGTKIAFDSALPVLGMDSVPIVDVVCGADFTVLVTVSGNLYTFGQGLSGQLGHGDTKERTQPLFLASMQGKHIISVACGHSHVIAVDDKGYIWGWGSNDFGQLAQKDLVPKSASSTPYLVSSVQLPENTSPIISSPIILVSLFPLFVTSIVCGGRHNVIIGKARESSLVGMEFSDSKSRGTTKTTTTITITPAEQEKSTGNAPMEVDQDKKSQPGSQSQSQSQTQSQSQQSQTPAPSNLEALPMEISDKSGNQAHSSETADVEQFLGPIPSYPTMYVFGKGTNGQLGLKNFLTALLPQRNTFFDLSSETGSNRKFIIGCGEAHTLVFLNSDELSESTSPLSSSPLSISPSFLPTSSSSALLRSAGLPSRSLVTSQMIETLSVTNVRKFTEILSENISDSSSEGVLQNLLIYLDKAFSWPTILNASFLEENHLDVGENHSGVDMAQVREAWTKILKLQQPRVMVLVNQSIARCLSKHKPSLPINPETMRLYLIIMENPTLQEVTRYNLSLTERLVTSITSLPKEARHTLYSWWSKLPSEYFSRVVRVFQAFLSYVALNAVDDKLSFSVTQLLSALYKINTNVNIVPYSLFYNEDVSPGADLETLYKKWVSAGSSSVFSFLNYPFYLSPASKTRLLHIDAAYQKFHQSITTPTQPFLLLQVRRDHVIMDALQQLSQTSRYDLKKPLKIHFVDEIGVDEGGLRKEFFQIITQQLFKPDYGLFKWQKDTGTWWFSTDRKVLSDYDEYFFVGLVFGLAIYNSIIMDVRFPVVIYKKLLGTCPGVSYTQRHKYQLTLADLKETFPTVGNNLQKLLDYKPKTQNVDEEFEDVFGQTFQVSYDSYGSVVTDDLIPNGGEIPVTYSNRHRYVDVYVDYLLNTSIEKPFSAFSRGFMLVCSGPVLELFRAEELALCVEGEAEELNTQILSDITVYKAGYDRHHVTVLTFWEVVHSFSQEEKKKLLLFTTGTDRLPIGGVKNLHFAIQRHGPDTEILPTAITCFNTLLLPQYSSKEKLKNKLLIAINNFQGFGLV